jgi:hypothetical protein
MTRPPQPVSEAVAKITAEFVNFASRDNMAIANWLQAIGVFLAVVVALFQEHIRRWFFRPAFSISSSINEPDFAQVLKERKDGKDTIAYFLRISIWNVGKDPARNVEVYAKASSRREGGVWERVEAFPPMNLIWSNSPEPKESYIDRVFLRQLPADTAKPCDIGHLMSPQLRPDFGEFRTGSKSEEASLTFDLIVSPPNKKHIVGPGTYHLNIVVAAENAKPLHGCIQITVPQSWHNDPKTMRTSGVAVQVFAPCRCFTL